MPPYVAIPDSPALSSSGYLTPAYDPFAVSGDPNQENFRVPNLTPPDRLTLNRLLRRRAMVKSLDEFARDVPPTPLTTSRDQFADRAYSLMTSSATQAAFRLDDESPSPGRGKCFRSALEHPAITNGQETVVGRELDIRTISSEIRTVSVGFLLHDRRRLLTICPDSLRGHGASSFSLAGKALKFSSIRR